MKSIRIFRHLACEGPGYLGEILADRDIGYDIVCIDEGHSVPMSLDGIAGMVFMGGSMSVNDPLDWVTAEIELIKQAKVCDLPMLGICLGGQLLSKAFGAKVSRGEQGQEIGWHCVERLDNSSADDWLGDLPARLGVFHWHGETFTIPHGAECILRSDCYANQAWVCGNTLALQCHPEMTADMVRQWTGLYTDDLAQGGDCNMPADDILADLDSKVAGLRPLASQLFNRWLDRLAT
jgi:GMP synthase-like glutamine amidotransferase